VFGGDDYALGWDSTNEQEIKKSDKAKSNQTKKSLHFPSSELALK
jgi:hypothetical protein